MLAISSTVFATDHPELSELTPLLTRPNSSDEVQALVKKYQLKKIYKFASGSFTSEDQAYTLMFRENRINAIILPRFAMAERVWRSQLGDLLASLATKLEGDGLSQGCRR